MNTIAKIAIVDHDGTRETTWTQLLEVATKSACHARCEGLSGIVPILQGRTMLVLREPRAFRQSRSNHAGIYPIWL